MRTKALSLISLLAVVFVLSAGPAHAVTGVYMAAIGQSQGEIMGSVDIPGHEGTMEVTRVEHLIETPFDPDTGWPTGERRHNPIVIRKPVDRATPLLVMAYLNEERLQNVWIMFYRLNYVGQEEVYFVVYLVNALIVRHQQMLPAEIDPQSGTQLHWEEIACTYERIGWNWVPEGIYIEDSWTGYVGDLVVRPGKDGAALSMWPNPSCGEAVIAFGAPENLPAELQVLDAGGRVIFHQSEPGGQRRILWDGRDSSGRELPAGAYFLRLAWDGGAQSKRVTLVR